MVDEEAKLHDYEHKNVIPQSYKPHRYESGHAEETSVVCAKVLE